MSWLVMMSGTHELAIWMAYKKEEKCEDFKKRLQQALKKNCFSPFPTEEEILYDYQITQEDAVLENDCSMDCLYGAGEPSTTVNISDIKQFTTRKLTSRIR